MRIGVRRSMMTGVLVGLMMSGIFAGTSLAQDPAAGQLSEEQLGQLIQAIGLKPEKQEQRYDFAFRADVAEQQWELSMSAVLSQDGSAIWIMAWLDELPKSAAEVPRSALLRLLAENDKLGNGKFFAYIPTNRRFVLQRTVPNADMTSAKFRAYLQDLGSSVVETYPTWSTASWVPKSNQPAAAAATPADGAPTRSAANESKFEVPVRR
ncbi:type III secretion system chaperone [Maioricimonas sp. JC845]|uniref:type III secretion system chaperone n=1 Tax=Maioricimonas sp. JC845 TaxID=3232138 RepID=UPI00345822DB